MGAGLCPGGSASRDPGPNHSHRVCTKGRLCPQAEDVRGPSGRHRALDS